MRALLYSANIAAAELDDPPKAAELPGPDGLQLAGTSQAAAIARPNASDIFNGPLGWGTVAFSLIAGLGLFLFLPTAIAQGIDGLLGITNGLVSNLIESAVRLAILVAYIAATGLMPDIRRVYGYHGAEHKTINAYEAGASLTPQSVKQYPIEHPRCGTAFLLTVALLTVVIFAPLPRDPLWLRFATRLLLFPVVAGIGYEILRFTAAHVNNPLIRVLIAPNLALQRLTTREPDDSMLEVAIAALERVLASEFAEPAPAVAVEAVVAPTSVTTN
jgi:uncharacterized protein YqhQ